MRFSDGKFFALRGSSWNVQQNVVAAKWSCAYCGNTVASNVGWSALAQGVGNYYIRLCIFCNGPTFFAEPIGEHFPVAAPGSTVPNVPESLNTLYEEARASAGAGAPTAAVLACRKVLMNVAVAEGAEEGQTFVQYVEFLDGKGYVPPHGKAWVDYIRLKGNEATHEIALMTDDDAAGLIALVEKLLRDIYDFPKRVPKVAVQES